MAGAVTHVLELSYQASAALTKMRFVKLSANQTVAPVAAITDKALGVIDTDVSAAEFPLGKSVAVACEGVAWVEAAAAITADAFVAPSANGRAQTAVTTQFVAGRALKAAAAAGDLIPVLLQRADRAL
jgi:hypothetical protein